jgi:regulator of nucleoside diphosphate kinase
MKYETLIIDSKEFDYLKQVLATSPLNSDSTYKASLSKFAEELKVAKICESDAIPGDVVRMNSTVTIQDPYRNFNSYQIVRPENRNIAENRISIVAPMALAVFGYAEGDEVLWQFPSGLQTIKIVKVEQKSTSEKKSVI